MKTFVERIASCANWRVELAEEVFRNETDRSLKSHRKITIIEKYHFASPLKLQVRYTYAQVSETTLITPLRYASQAAASIEKPALTPISTSGTRSATEANSSLKTKIMHFLYNHQQNPIPTTEKNIVLTNCPHCIKVRKNSFAAYVDLQKGTYKCTTCKSKGSFSEFSRTLSKKIKLATTENNFSILPTTSLLSKTNSELSRSPADLDQFVKTLHENGELLAQINKQHLIQQDTLNAYGVGVTFVDNQPYLTFPQTTLTYEDEAFKTSTIRFKLCDLQNPKQLKEIDPPATSKESKAGLFGYHLASYKDDTVVLARTELDAMAAYQTTGIPAVSLPTSNYQLQESILPLLDRFKRIYLWLDDDVDGQIAAERFARKIGEHRCMIVNTRQGDQQGPLNAHDALIQNRDLKSILENGVRTIKHDQIVDFHDLREEVYNEILHPEQTKGVQCNDIPQLNEIIKGHRSGELTILTGPTGVGKTTIISQLSLDFCKSGVPTLWGSFEIMNKRLAKKMLYQFAGKDLSLHPEEFDKVANQFEQLPLYFLKFFSSTAIKDVLKACQHAVNAYDVRHIILDNLQFMLSQQHMNGMDKWDLQDNAIAEIRNFATQQDVHVTLVVHPRKDNGSGDELDINSIFGSAKVTQEADNVIILQKSKTNARSIDIKKNRFDGTLGSIPYKFDRETYKIRQFTAEELMKLKKEQFKYGSTSVVYRK
ncbi:P-loop containing nucleoside triphosphate hydrolase protein [Mycotypha africana]|uniref:P-loop containing nucleoside triphosphate hydrolase protein n=1 Tax=Mycotypha africana TaxID=64632 RepID=UPI00230155D1|nr:P-loop containing nucleoside triphosphate hydrolase protein [Mycotypha africana]KAI8967757.1 P-loop containing nucleoside triphosphate hydrolase protein [Mycotypha africana]